MRHLAAPSTGCSVSCAARSRARGNGSPWLDEEVAVQDSAGRVELRLPDLAGARSWVESSEDPLVRLMVATWLSGGEAAPELDGLRAEATAADVVRAALNAQRDDGSWGEPEPPTRRVLPTLLMAKALAELGVARHDGWTSAVGFLAEVAHTDDGVLSLDGRRDGVLSCYVGIAASMYLLGDRPDLAQPQVRWILDHQQVRRGGRDLRTVPAEHYSDHLAVRYGGCMSETTCLVGLVKTGQALRLWRDAHEGRADDRVVDLLVSIREAFLSRRLFLAADGSTLPLGVMPKHAEDWLRPTYPLDWRTDLIEVLDLVASTGPPDVRLQPALDRLAGFQLPDRSWPLLRTLRPADLPLLERRSRTRGSAFITTRVLAALAPLRRP